ncbi:hypothetical protein VUR80DRAFT_2417 [Thermomyces stellatus]
MRRRCKLRLSLGNPINPSRWHAVVRLNLVGTRRVGLLRRRVGSRLMKGYLTGVTTTGAGIPLPVQLPREMSCSVGSDRFPAVKESRGSQGLRIFEFSPVPTLRTRAQKRCLPGTHPPKSRGPKVCPRSSTTKGDRVPHRNPARQLSRGKRSRYQPEGGTSRRILDEWGMCSLRRWKTWGSDARIARAHRDPID